MPSKPGPELNHNADVFERLWTTDKVHIAMLYQLAFLLAEPFAYNSEPVVLASIADPFKVNVGVAWIDCFSFSSSASSSLLSS